MGRKPAKNQSIAGPSGIGSEAKQPVVKSPINFQEFLKRKAESRKEHFKFKPKSAKKVEKDVSINIGIMRYVNGTLKFCRGRNLPVTVPSSASRDDILTKAVTKHNENKTWRILKKGTTGYQCVILFLFAATFFICSNFFYLQQLFLFAATFFICSNFFYLQQLFLFAATFFYLQQLSFYLQQPFLFA